MNLVFNTQMMLITLTVIISQFSLLSFIVISVLSKPKDKSRLHFLILTICFLFYNIISGLLPDDTISISMIFQNILIYGSAILMASYYFVFLSQEFKFNFNSAFCVKILFLSLISSYVFGYGITYFITRHHKNSYYVFISLAILVSIYFCYKSLIQFTHQLRKIKKGTPQKLIFYACYIGVVLIALLQIESILGGHQGLEIITVNTAYYLLAITFIKRHIYIQNVKTTKENKYNEDNLKVNAIEFVSLTPKELEIKDYILQNLLYKDIAENLNITEKTVGKHASNIYKKTNSEDKIGFIKKYSSSSTK